MKYFHRSKIINYHFDQQIIFQSYKIVFRYYSSTFSIDFVDLSSLLTKFALFSYILLNIKKTIINEVY